MLKVTLWILLSWFIQRKVCEKRSSITAQVTRIIIIQDDNKKYYRQSKESQNRRFNYVCHFWLNEWRDEYLLIEAKVTTDSLIMFLTQVWILNTCASSFIIFDETILIILQVFVTDSFIFILFTLFENCSKCRIWFFEFWQPIQIVLLARKRA